MKKNYKMNETLLINAYHFYEIYGSFKKAKILLFLHYSFSFFINSSIICTLS